MYIEQMSSEGTFESGSIFKVADCLRQTVPDSRADVRKGSIARCFCAFTGVVTRVRVFDADRNCLVGVYG